MPQLSQMFDMLSFHFDTGAASSQEGNLLPFEKASSYSNCLITLLNSLLKLGNIISAVH